ncbi:MAG: hypothetical protein M3T96_05980 [Acidobacteriota bacterium]|nr:hypothetical protein [Acidobacteriota bacterium]
MRWCEIHIITRQETGGRIYAVKSRWKLNNSIRSKIVVMAFSMAEVEGDSIAQRVKEALRCKKGTGHQTRQTEKSRQIKAR